MLFNSWRRWHVMPGLRRFTKWSLNGEVKAALLIFTCVTFINVSMVTYFHLRHFASDDFARRFRWYRFPSRCQTPLGIARDMKSLTVRTSKVLSRLSIPAALCYGTLWGVLRKGAFLPWDDNVDFCLLNSQLKNVSFEQLRRAFSREGIALGRYDWDKGSYAISRGEAVGEINVFGDCSTLFYLVHWEFDNDFPSAMSDLEMEFPRWACPMGVSPTAARFAHGLNKPLPQWLLEPPLSVSKLDGEAVNVPRDELEIQKYLYPDDWWLESKPPGC